MVGKPTYDDVGVLARALIRHVPERMIWATSFPHAQADKLGYPDESALLDLLLDWASNETDRQKIFVDNPAECTLSDALPAISLDGGPCSLHIAPVVAHPVAMTFRAGPRERGALQLLFRPAQRLQLLFIATQVTRGVSSVPASDRYAAGDSRPAPSYALFQGFCFDQF